MILLARILTGSQVALHRLMYVWRRMMSAVLNMKITQNGSIEGQCIVMSNHRSYTDILLHQTGHPVVFVAKKSVRSWPIVGWAGRVLGVIFVERSSQSSRAHTREAIRDRLSRGMSVLIYPEGTTHRGPDILDYRPGIFKVAAEEGFPIVASAIEYENQDMAWTGTATFIPHFLKTFGALRMRSTVSFSEPFTNTDPDILKREVMEWTQRELLRIRKNYDA